MKCVSMKKVISTFACVLLGLGSAGICHAEPVMEVYKSSFQTPININQLEKLDQDIIFANYLNSLSNFYSRECPKLHPNYKIETQKIREKLPKIYPNVFIDYQRSNQWFSHLNNLSLRQLETLKVVTAIREMDKSFENSVLVSDSTCQSYVQSNQGDFRQFWQNSYDNTLPVLIDGFNQTYKNSINFP